MFANFIGQVCMVRTYSAGVFFGKVEKLSGKEAVISNARRVWYWSGAASLNELASEGTKDPAGCKFPTPVDSVYLSEVIEVIPMTEAAIESLSAVKIWTAE